MKTEIIIIQKTNLEHLKMKKVQIKTRLMKMKVAMMKKLKKTRKMAKMKKVKSLHKKIIKIKFNKIKNLKINRKKY